MSNRKAADVFALFLCLVGMGLLMLSIRSYMIDARYLPRAFGVREPFVQTGYAFGGGVFLLLSTVLNRAVRRVDK